MAEQNEVIVKKKRKPSLRATKAISNLVENGGNKTKAMIDAGYSPETANTPSKVFDSVKVKDAFGELLDKYIPDEKLLKVLDDGLEATRSIVVGSGENSDVIDSPDHAVRHKYLETGLKLKGKLKQDGGGAVAVQVNFNDLRGKYK